MAPLSLLIAGRGFPALFAARLAERRGYRTTLLLDPDPAPLSVVMGGGGGILSRLESEVGAALSPTPPMPLSTPAMLSMGPPARYFFAPLPGSSPAPEEASRFQFSLIPELSQAVFPELSRTMALSHGKTSTVAPFFSRLTNWIFEPEREKERLPRKLAAEARRLIAPAESLLLSLLPLAGLVGRLPGDPAALRLLQNATPGRLVAVSPPTSLPVPPQDVTLWRGKLPAALEPCGHGRRYRIAGETEEFDRVLLLTEPPDPAFVSGVVDLDPRAMPPHWPTVVHFPRKETEGTGETEGGALLVVEHSGNGGRPRGWIWSELLPEEDPAHALLAGVERLNAQTLVPALDRPTLVRREVHPLLFMDSLPLGGLRETTAYLKKGGHLSLLRDPTLLPLVSEDFWADLSLALPARERGR